MAETCQVSGILWGDFQSLAQLAVALNTGFAAFTDFLGDSLVQEGKRVRTAIRRVEARNITAVDFSGNPPATRLKLLYGKSEGIRRSHMEKLSVFGRPLFAIGAILSLSLLIVSSYIPRCSMSHVWQILTIISYLPVCAVFILTIITLLNIYFKVSIKRRIIIKQIEDFLNRREGGLDAS